MYEEEGEGGGGSCTSRSIGAGVLALLVLLCLLACRNGSDLRTCSAVARSVRGIFSATWAEGEVTSSTGRS